MDIRLMDIIMVSLMTSLSCWFFYKTNIFHNKRNHLIVTSLVIFIAGISVIYRTEEGPMQSLYLVVFFLISVLTVIDFYKKEIHLELFLTIIPIGVANIYLFLDQWSIQKIMMTGGVIVFFLLIGYIFRASIGWGDIFLFILLVIVLEFQTSVFVIIAAFTLAGLFGLLMFSIRRVSRNMEIPFTPFLLVSYMLFIFL